MFPGRADRRVPDVRCLFDVAPVTASNDQVDNRGRDADADVIVAGPEPRGRPLRPALAWLLVIAETAALAVSVAFALHYRAETGGLHHGGSSAAGLPMPPLPQMTSVALRLPAGGPVVGMVVITAVAVPGADRAQFTVSAVITGGRAGTAYDLTGNDCSDAAPLPDHVWATGLAGADGTAELAGYPWTGAVADRYWLALAPSPASPPPGLRGQFALGKAAPFPAGQAPCAPSP
jgi:hypothetical protein